MMSVLASAEPSSMFYNAISDMSMSPQIHSSGPSYILYGMAALGILSLLCSLFCFYKIGRIQADNRFKIKKFFVGGIFLFVVGSFILAYFSYTAGQNHIPYIGHPGFDPRTT